MHLPCRASLQRLALFDTGRSSEAAFIIVRLPTLISTMTMITTIIGGDYVRRRPCLSVTAKQSTVATKRNEMQLDLPNGDVRWNANVFPGLVRRYQCIK